MNGLLEIVKQALRVSTTFTDAELRMYVNACLTDLKNTGVSENKTQEYEDDMIILACVSFCKFNFGNIDVSQKKFFEEQYRKISGKLSFVSEYNGEV